MINSSGTDLVGDIKLNEIYKIIAIYTRNNLSRLNKHNLRACA